MEIIKSRLVRQTVASLERETKKPPATQAS